MSMWRFLLCLLALPVGPYAACTTPDGDVGHIIFNTTTKTMQYCNGTNWVNTGKSEPTATQTGCVSPTGVVGEVIYASNTGVIQFCNGQNWVDTACAADRSPNGSGCAGQSAGTIRYTTTHNELQFCDSTDWVAMGWGCQSSSGPVILPEPEVVAYVSSSTNNLVISSLFSNGDWTDGTKRKRLIINSGVTVGSTSAATPALSTGTGRLHSLIIENNGTIAGAGGTANGGAGGNALLVQETSVTVLNTGHLYGGGGGGGRGGNGGTGGAGSYNTLVRQPSSGDYYDAGEYAVGYNIWSWAGSVVGTGAASSLSAGGYTYYRGTPHGSNYNGIYRTYNSATGTTGGAGGTGGNGGLGQGSNQTNTAGAAGAAGAAGGTNAGTGGTSGAGGAGGTWGVAGTAGSSGSAGAAGNAGSGTAGLSGSAGGAAGAAITGSGYTVNNSGSILGAY